MSSRKTKAQLQRILQGTFGLEKLRPTQRQVIDLVMAGNNVIAILPTGAGKSLCYQLPAVHLPGMTVVVSPLIALMKDQADSLRNLGVAAAELNSTLSTSDQKEVLESVARGEIDFLFVTPERLARPDFLAQLKKVQIDLFVIDEAHCLSQWGHDFRPDYLALGTALKALGKPQVLALTATATPKVAEDVRQQLGLEDLKLVSASVYRDNLDLAVECLESEAQKNARILDHVQQSTGPAIVYTATVKAAEAVQEMLVASGIPAGLYHGKLPAKERQRSQDDFMSEKIPVIVATNAFGLGIDKPNIRLVLHHSFPATLEAYYQEAGRAGRDGAPSQCILLYLKKDKATQSFFMAGRYPGFAQVKALYAYFLSLRESEPTTSFSLKEIQEAVGSEIAKSKVQVLMNAFKEEGIVSELKGRRFKMRKVDLSEAELENLHKRYELKAENDQAKLKRMIMYCQTALCRWRMLWSYFGEAPEQESCEHCDNCKKHLTEQLPAALTPVSVAV